MIQAFVSSTYTDLKDHRAYVIDRLARCGIFVDPMEKWAAADDAPKKLSVQRVKDCDFCVLLVGFRRGFVPEGEPLSITQMEYRAAVECGLEVFIFIANEKADWPEDALAGLRDDPKIAQWRNDLPKDKVVGFFTPQPQSIDVDAAVARWLMTKWSARHGAETDGSLDAASRDAMSIDIRAYTNSDGVLLAWRTARPIEGCRGFAIHRRLLGDAGVTEDVVPSLFRKDGEFQNFKRVLPLDPQQEARYRVTPVIGPPDALGEAAGQHAGSGWTPWLSLRTGSQPGCRAYFNRGEMSRSRLASDKATASEDSMLRKLRRNGERDHKFLGAGLRDELLTLLTGARLSGQRVSAALADLDDPDLVNGLKDIGKNLRLLLGPIRPGPNSREASRVRVTLRGELEQAGVQVFEQKLQKGGSALSNFAVFCDSLGTPARLWTGSTAWTSRALFLRSNSALVVDSPVLARAYLDLWDELHDNASRPRLPFHLRESGMSITVWATPTPGHGDLRDVIRLIRGARQGIMFLFDEQQAAAKVKMEILRLRSDRDLFIEGISWSRHNGNKGLVSCEYRVNDEAPVVGEPSSGPFFDGMIVLIDPFGPHPAIVTGSHDLSKATSIRNQSDLLIIENAPALAAEYAVHMSHQMLGFKWRRYVAAVKKGKSPPAQLQQTDKWQQPFFEGTRRSEFNFLFGALSPRL